MTTSAPTPTASPASAPSSGTYSIYAQDLGVFLEFTDGNAGTNLTTWQPAPGNASQQVRFPVFTALVLMLTQLTVACHGKLIDKLYILERPLRKLYILYGLSEHCGRKPDPICLVPSSVRRGFCASARSS